VGTDFALFAGRVKGVIAVALFSAYRERGAGTGGDAAGTAPACLRGLPRGILGA
jgi:hypothetical protein